MTEKYFDWGHLWIGLGLIGRVTATTVGLLYLCAPRRPRDRRDGAGNPATARPQLGADRRAAEPAPGQRGRGRDGHQADLTTKRPLGITRRVCLDGRRRRHAHPRLGPRRRRPARRLHRRAADLQRHDSRDLHSHPQGHGLRRGIQHECCGDHGPGARPRARPAHVAVRRSDRGRSRLRSAEREARSSTRTDEWTSILPGAVTCRDRARAAPRSAQPEGARAGFRA